MRAAVFSLLGLAVASLLTACARRADPAPASVATAISVRTARVASVPLPLTQPIAATILPLERATIAARVRGAVTGATFAVGQPVQPGELLLTLAATEFAARLDLARAAFAQAEREHTREAALLEKRSTAADAVLAAADRRRLAQAAVAEAEALLAYTRVTAPFAGTVTQKFVNSGDVVASGAPLFAVEATGHLRAELPVPESLPALALGTGIAVRLSPTGAPVTATLAEFSTAADPITRTRLAKLDLPADAPARSGQFARVLWPAGTATGVVVPADALSVFGQMERVFTVNPDGRAQLRLVKSGARSGSAVEILAGLDAGETVILAPAATLRDGQPVAVTP